MRTHMRLKFQLPRHLPEQFRGEELRYPEELAAAFIQRFTRPGAVVLDPFAGYGTTLLVAQSMGRRAYGLEYDERRVAYTRTLLAEPGQLRQGDARQLGSYAFPPADLIMGAPPFMAAHEQENVLRGTTSANAYAEYLRDLATVGYACAAQLAPGGHVVFEIANLKDEHGITTLAWDAARVLGEGLEFLGEIVLAWDRYLYGYDHSYGLVFRQRPAREAAENHP